jgi:hypothetical protein
VERQWASTKLVERAVTFIREHFDHLNQGEIDTARTQLYFPDSLSQLPLDRYLSGMMGIRPFQSISIMVRAFESRAIKAQHVVSTVWTTVTAECALGQRTSPMIVWYLIEHDRFLISTRPTHWAVEHRMRQGVD